MLDQVLGRRPMAGAPVPANGGNPGVPLRNLYADAAAGATAVAAPISPEGGNAAVAAGVLAFAAVGVLVAMRFIFRGAVS